MTRRWILLLMLLAVPSAWPGPAVGAVAVATDTDTVEERCSAEGVRARRFQVHAGPTRAAAPTPAVREQDRLSRAAATSAATSWMPGARRTPARSASAPADLPPSPDDH